MSRLSREKKREQKQAARAATPATPIDVHVPGAGTDVGGGAGGVSDGASVGGVPVFAAPGEEIQRAVLNRLHHIALATGHPVLATIRDERIGYVVPLQVDPDGSSHFTAEPVATAPPEPPRHVRGDMPPEPQHARGTDAVQPPEPRPARGGDAMTPPEPEYTPSGGAPAPELRHAREDSATHVLRRPQESGSAPTFPLRAVPEPEPADEPVPTFELRAVPESAEPAPEEAPPAPGTAMPPGTVAPPTGAFGPPPPMDARPLPVPETPPAPRPGAVPDPALIAADPDPKPTPPRGFDAVAEAVLGDGPLTAPGDPGAPALLAEPVGRINEAVKEGRIEDAAGLAEQTVAQASGALGPEHPEVLRLRELTAYIAYLAGDPLRACRLSLDLAGARRRAGDAEAAYGNVESAATAWRAVRDPALGLELGRDLIGLWTELAAEDGPAAEEVEQLESARARMGRLTERAARNP
ncbi:tetratricopeptide repeat protein [Streptomyces massasporeus]|uniref:tetratricopeptide repeat protein n=1 Tax=Streptomyces massasporeus TaxID=67324 RepID=UPI0036D16169